MSKFNLENKVVYYSFLSLLVLIAILAAILLKNFIGFAPGIDSQAGNVTALKIYDQRDTLRWHGLFGLAFMEPGFGEEQSVDVTPGEITSKIFVFECIDPLNNNQELYAALINNVSFDNVSAGDYSMIDSLFNLSENNSDNAQRTFTDFVNISLGSTLIQNIPAVYTYVDSNPDGAKSFYTGILNASGDLLLVTRYYHESQNSFKSSSTRFQTLLPTPNSSITYYYFVDPNDQCPGGLSLGQAGDALVQGYVFNSLTSQGIPNAMVSVGGNQSFTDANGFFNMSVPGGYYYDLLSIKQGFITNITAINTTIGLTTHQNLTMAPDPGLVGPNGSVRGYVRDNSTNLPLANVTIAAHAKTLYSNASGNFSFNLSQGVYVIAASLPGYLPFVGNVTIIANQNLSYIINMTPFVQGTIAPDATVKQNGTFYGFVSDNETNQSLQDVRVSLNGLVNFTNVNGLYNMTTFEGTTNLVATKANYNVFIHEVNISANNITRFNFSMGRIIAQEEDLNGTIAGFVRNSQGQLVSGAFVASAGIATLSDSSGFYNLSAIIPGTHNIISTAASYRTYVSTVNVSENQTTYHNITLETIITAGLGTGQGPGQGAGSGAGLGPGQGPGTGIKAQTEQPTVILDYDISIRKIIEKIREGNFLTVPVTIRNYKEDTISIKLEIEGSAKKLIRLDRTRFSIESTATAEVTLTILGNEEPGIYEGYLAISGDIEDKIPIYILLYEKDLLDVEGLKLDIVAQKKKVSPGKKLQFRVDLQNLLEDEPYKVDLSYELEGISKNVTYPIETENIYLITSYSLVKSFALPEEISLGQYRLKAKASYLGIESDAQTIIEVKDPWYLYRFFGLIPLWVLALIGISAATIAYLIWFFKKRAEDKKRYHIDLDYNQLPKPGPRSAFVGLIAETTKKTYFDLDVMQTHTLVAGSTGGGKTVAAQSIIEEALLHGASVLVFDPTVQWTGFLSRCQDKRFLELYARFGLKKSDARAFNGNIHQVTDPREIIDFNKFMKPGEINVFVVNKLDTRDYEIFVSNTIREVFKENMPESRQLKLMLVFDEFHRLLPKYGGTGQVLIQVERAAREFRKWGVGLVLISQVISDFQSEVLANINTQIQMRTKDEGDLTRTKNEYGERYLQSLVKAAVGAGMVENSNYNKGKPYFVQFRPLLHSTVRISDADLENYNKYNRVIDDLDYQLEQLEKEGIDIFDLKLELKLALDKVKAGSFNMVDIYLEGLTPRLKGFWSKLGKEPKQREIRRISEAELKKELDKAKKWRDKVEGKTPAQEEPTEEKPAGDDEPVAEETPVDSAKQEQEEQQNVESAIGKAKAAREKKIESDKAQEKQEQANQNKPRKPGSGPSGPAPLDHTIEETLQEVDNALHASNKAALISLYKELQVAYRLATKEMKLAILDKCKSIQKVIAQ